MDSRRKVGARVSELQIIPWFNGDPITVEAIADSDKVAYSWASLSGVPDEPKTINHLLIWHDCDHHLWYEDPTKNHKLIPDYVGWHPAGVGLHDLISADPLHIEASVYWPDCCGMHGWIRDGRWIPA